jgi:hypothetical protein
MEESFVMILVPLKTELVLLCSYPPYRSSIVLALFLFLAKRIIFVMIKRSVDPIVIEPRVLGRPEIVLKPALPDLETVLRIIVFNVQGWLKMVVVEM